MLLCLGTSGAWSVFVLPLQAQHGYSFAQLQFVYTTAIINFALMMIVGGRLYDRWGARPMVLASALLILTAWTLASRLGGHHYLFLWFTMGVLASAGSALCYVCPISIAMHWFPERRGLVGGLAATGFAGGPILLSSLAEWLMRQGWDPMQIFGAIGLIYAPVVLSVGLILKLPPHPHAPLVHAPFRRRTLMRDRRFWALFAGMFAGTLPFLVVIGNAKPLAIDFGLAAEIAVLAITVLASGNIVGRIVWGFANDRLGPRRVIVGMHVLTFTAMLCILAAGFWTPWLLLPASLLLGFCYGGHFAVYPATCARIFGPHVLGSVYPLIMAAQGLASLATLANGLLLDRFASHYPGLFLAMGCVLAGGALSYRLTRSMDEDTRQGRHTPPPTTPEEEEVVIVESLS